MPKIATRGKSTHIYFNDHSPISELHGSVSNTGESLYSTPRCLIENQLESILQLHADFDQEEGAYIVPSDILNFTKPKNDEIPENDFDEDEEHIYYQISTEILA